MFSLPLLSRLWPHISKLNTQLKRLQNVAMASFWPLTHEFDEGKHCTVSGATCWYQTKTVIFGDFDQTDRWWNIEFVMATELKQRSKMHPIIIQVRSYHPYPGSSIRYLDRYKSYIQPHLRLHSTSNIWHTLCKHN